MIANGPGDWVSISGRILPKTQDKDQGQVEQSRERSSVLSYTSNVVAIEKRAFWLSSTSVGQLTYILCMSYLPLENFICQMTHVFSKPLRYEQNVTESSS